MNFIELFINDPATANLDLNQEMDVALQYSIADIKDISKRNAAYSKTIIIPGTKNNNYWFGNLFDVNADFSMFNPNKKTSARLLVNGETVIDGFLQLRKIVKLNNTDQQGNMINYEVVIFNNAVDLMTELGEKTINQLDLSEFGHTFSASNIKASWDNTYRDGYVYPMYGTHTKNNQYKPEYFYPAIFYRTMLDQMVREAGFGWTGSLITNDQFNHEVIAYVTDGRPKIDEEERRRREFKVGITPIPKEVNLGNYPNTFTGNFPLGIGSGYGTPASGWTFSFNDESAPYYDNDNNWDSSLYTWNVDRNGKYSASYNLSYNFNLKNSSSTVTMVKNTTINKYPQVKLDHFLQYKKVGTTNWINWDVSSQFINYNVDTIAPGASASKPVYVARQAPILDLSIGDKVRLIWKGYQNNDGWWNGTGGYATPAMTARMVFNNLNGGNWISNNAETSEFTQNDFINLAAYLPDKVKQKDLLGDLIKRYNLYIQTDPDNPKMLIFDTRPDFYNRGTIVDWTNKKDFSIVDEVELLSDLQYKLMIWSYKADTSDDYNKEYGQVTGDVYGQYKYYFDNDFVKGEERIESQFSPTPLVKTPFNAIVPGINPENPKVQPRIFYWGGLKDCSDGWQWTYQLPTGATGSTESFTQYPYAGHFDDPLDPQVDINFGTCKYYFYNDWASLPDGNMFNTYWGDYVRQIENGKLVTSHFYLDEYDIRFIKDNFYTKIFIVDSYYYVNKIIDYKPLNNGLTKVELIKIVDGVTWKAPKRVTTFKDISQRENQVYNRFEDLEVGHGNVNSGGGVVFGHDNVVGGKVQREEFSALKRNLTIGDNNRNMGDASLILGYNNTIVEDNSSILSGRDNTIEGENVVLIGSNGLTITDNNVVYLGNSFSVNTITGEVYAPGLTISGGATPSLNDVLEVGGLAGNHNIYFPNNWGVRNATGITSSTGLGFDSDAVFLHAGTGSVEDYSARATIAATKNGSAVIQVENDVEFNMNLGGLGAGLFTIYGYSGFNGIEYSADYSANYTNRSLVDKEYVDTHGGGGGATPSLSSVLSVGNDSDIYDLIMGTATTIKTNGGTGRILLDSLGDGDIVKIDASNGGGFGYVSIDGAGYVSLVANNGLGSLSELNLETYSKLSQTGGDFTSELVLDPLGNWDTTKLTERHTAGGTAGNISFGQGGNRILTNVSDGVSNQLYTDLDLGNMELVSSVTNGTDTSYTSIHPDSIEYHTKYNGLFRVDTGSALSELNLSGSAGYILNTAGEGRNTYLNAQYDYAEMKQVEGTSVIRSQASLDNGFYQSQYVSTGISKGVSKMNFRSLQTTDGATVSVVWPLSGLEVGTTAVGIKATVTGMKSDDTQAYLAELYAAVRMNAYAVTIFGGVDKLEKSEFTTATSTIEIETSNVAIRVIGEASTTINWSVKYELIYSV